MMVSQTNFSSFRKYNKHLLYYEIKFIKFQNIMFIAICLGYNGVLPFSTDLF